MTRLELLKIVVGQARTNGFEFRPWYTRTFGVPWTTAGAAFSLLETQRRYYSLLFSHEFASSFWKNGSEITFRVEQQTFQRVMPDGKVRTITRRPFTRRSSRKDVWRYHLQQMAVADDPLRYIRKYLRVQGDLDESLSSAGNSGQGSGGTTQRRDPPKRGKQPAKSAGRPLPSGPPAFLQRPYP